MSELWICREQTAKKPFRLENPELEIHTIEELCFYLYQNVNRLDEEIMGEELFVWLGEELKLPRLAANLRQEKQQGKNGFWCAWFLLKEMGMYTEEELGDMQSLCKAMENKDEFECQKLKADRMLQNKRYLRSIEEYYRLLNMRQEDGRYPRLSGDIWHNIGVAHTRLFLFPEAADCFEKAYGLNQREESREAWQETLRIIEQEQQENALLSAAEDVEWDTCLQQLKNEYKKKVM